jgi:hypothetical protein
MLGYLLIGLSVLILLGVLYGHTEREKFTNMKGSFPSWIELVKQARKILDKHFEYDAAKFAEMVEQQADLFDFKDFKESTSLTSMPEATKEYTQGIKKKYLPKDFVFNIDTPYDNQMAFAYATQRELLDKLKDPKSSGQQILMSYGQYYGIDAFAAKMKAVMINKILMKFDEATHPKPLK